MACGMLLPRDRCFRTLIKHMEKTKLNGNWSRLERNTISDFTHLTKFYLFYKKNISQFIEGYSAVLHYAFHRDMLKAFNNFAGKGKLIFFTTVLILYRVEHFKTVQIPIPENCLNTESLIKSALSTCDQWHLVALLCTVHYKIAFRNGWLPAVTWFSQQCVGLAHGNRNSISRKVKTFSFFFRRIFLYVHEDYTLFHFYRIFNMLTYCGWELPIRFSMLRTWSFFII